MNKQINFLYRLFLHLRIRLDELAGASIVRWGRGNYIEPDWLIDGHGELLKKYGVYK
jgi:hypothetical protein